MNIDTSIFKAYDIRGVYPEQVNEELYYKIGQAYAKFLDTKDKKSGNEPSRKLTVAVGRDVRTSGPVLFKALTKGLMDHGVNVVDIGIIATDMMYFAVCHLGFDGGLAVTASHNPREYNGIKMVRAKGGPISGDNGIYDIRDLVITNYKLQVTNKGTITEKDILDDYIKKVLSVIDVSKIKPFKVVANINFGPLGKNLQKIADVLPLEIVWLNEEPNGDFPKGRPDPLIPENRDETIALIKSSGANLGVAWDSDADRCFFFDETGRFLSGYFTTAVLSEYFLKRYGPSKILMDSKLSWAVADKVKEYGGEAITSKTGHSFYKQKMMEQDAVFGGEVSAHMYFKDFFYLDNGLIPFLVMLEMLSVNGKKMSEMYKPYFTKYFAIEETNFKVRNVGEVIAAVKAKYSDAQMSELDGIAFEYPTWRCSVRGSNTEPVIRLNLEAKSKEVMDQRSRELTEVIKGFGL